MEFSILITMVVTLVGCLAGVVLMAGIATVVLLLTGHGFSRSFNNGILLGAVPLFLPAFLVACNLGFFLPTFEVIRDGVAATGTVVGYDESDSDGSTTYSSIVEFKTADGDTVTFDDTSVSSNPPRHNIGQQVGVLYLSDQPEKAVIRDPFWWIIPALLMAVSLVSLPIGYFLAWRSYRKGNFSVLQTAADMA
jgi:hypothetical protein